MASLGTIYLCGPIHGRTDEQCVVWREYVRREWPGECLDPIRRDYRGKELENVRQLIRDDLSDIRCSVGVLVYFDAPSVGTSMEIFFAKHNLLLPVVVVNVSTMDPLPAWLVGHADKIVNNLEDGIAALAEIIGDA